MKNEIISRIKKLQNKMQNRKLDAVLLTCDENVFYFSGFTGDSTQVLITKTDAYLFTDFRYIEQAQKETRGVTVFKTGTKERLPKIKEMEIKHQVKTLGIEKEFITLEVYESYLDAFDVDFYENISEEISQIRVIKSDAEIALMQKAATISDTVFNALIKQIKGGMTEVEISAELTYLFNKQGCGLSFTPIIASGENSALPHAPLTNRKVKNGDLLTIDFGCKMDNYCTDCTRTIAVGTLDTEQKKVYDIVKIAQEKALNAIKPGITCGQLDAVARDYIDTQGYKESFGHGLGHGVGLFIHEFPRVGSGDKTVLKEGMVITIEPGIYLKNRFGVRIEDMCYVAKDGAVSFNKLSKQLITV